MALKLFLLCVLIMQGASKELHGKENTAQDVQDTSLYNTNTVAFSAELSDQREYAGEVTIVFDKVMTNAGELYFPTTGQFACQDEGLYVFVWSALQAATIAGLEGMRCIQQLRSGGTDVKYGPKTNYHSTTVSGVAEMTAVVKCTTSPPTAVTVMSMPWSQDAGKTTVFRERYTSFSGFRLQSTTAFAAELMGDQYLIQGSRIRFDKVLSNHGGHYDSISHDFTCPDDGVYVFSVSTHTSDPTTPWSVSRLMMKGQVVMQGPITYIATQSYDSGSASTTAVLQCTEGVSVYVEAQAAHDFPFNSYAAELTSFTGFKLYDVVPGAVAFTAVMTNNHTTVTENQPLIFDETITNIGDAFDAGLSRFICPDDDHYLFTWTTAANAGSFGHTDLYMDNTIIKFLYLTNPSSDDSGTSGSSSISIIQQCSTGSRLQLVTRDIHESIFLGGYTSFSGYKIPGAWPK